MNLASILSQKQSTERRDMIIDYIGSDKKRMEELMSLFFSDNLRMCQNASWPMTYIAEKYPHLIAPYLARMNEKLDNPKHNAVIRNTVRIWQFMDIPEELEGPIYDRCFGYLADNNVAIAVRAFSVTVLFNLCVKFPDLKDELIEMMRDVYPFGSTGLKNRIKKTIQKLEKLN